MYKERIAQMDLSVPRLHEKKILCGINVSSAAIAVGILYTVTSIISVVTFSLGASNNMPSSEGYYPIFLQEHANENREAIAAFLISAAVLYALYGLCSIFVVVGVMTNRPRMLQPWVVLQWIDFGFSLIAACLIIILLAANGLGLAAVLALLIGSMIIGFKWCCLYVVHEHFKYLRNMNF